MFTFGLKKEEHEMFARTIIELQELRTELAQIKNALTALSSQENPESQGVECLDNPAEETVTLDGSETEDVAVIIPLFETSDSQSSLEPSKIEQLGPDEDKKIPGLQEAYVESDITNHRKDWAVVRSYSPKKIWWKGWSFEKKTSRRTM